MCIHAQGACSNLDGLLVGGAELLLVDHEARPQQPLGQVVVALHLQQRRQIGDARGRVQVALAEELDVQRQRGARLPIHTRRAHTPTT